MIKSLVLLCLLAIAANAQHDFCWRDSYGRGVGAPLHMCATGLDKNGALCYPQCKGGYYGVGPVCWAHCPQGMKDTGTQCEKQSYGRGAGIPLHTCKGNQDQNGALCYPKCGSGYYGVGPVCWQSCPSGYNDDGAFCRKDAHIYGKGCCCTIFGCCENKCEPGYANDPCTCRKDAHIFAKGSHGRGAGVPLSCGDNEEQNGGLCYPKPKPGFSGAGPVVWENCRGETIDFGAFCTKKSYGRTAGVPMICAPHEDQDAGLCYKKCETNFHGVGPVCWGDCPPGWASCGAGCAVRASECAGKIIDMIAAPAIFIAKLASAVVTAGGSVIATKTVEQTQKIAKIVKKSAKIAQKVTHMAKNIYQAAKDKGEEMTEQEAEELAEQNIEAAHDSENASDDSIESWEIAIEAIDAVDPTGAMSAAKAFIHPLCSKFIK